MQRAIMRNLFAPERWRRSKQRAEANLWAALAWRQGSTWRGLGSSEGIDGKAVAMRGARSCAQLNRCRDVEAYSLRACHRWCWEIDAERAWAMGGVARAVAV